MFNRIPTPPQGLPGFGYFSEFMRALQSTLDFIEERLRRVKEREFLLVDTDGVVQDAKTDIYLFDTSSGELAFYLAPANEVPHRVFVFKKDTANKVTLLPNGTDTIDGDPDYELTGSGHASVHLYSTGSTWLII